MSRVAVTGAALIAGAVLHRRPAAARRAAAAADLQGRVDYVEVDAVVTDRQGRIVRDLKKEDFQVLEDGKSQAITNFTMVDIPVERANRRCLATPIEPDVRTNESRSTAA